MSETVISVENLGKMYRLGSRQERYRTLRDSLVGTATKPFSAAGQRLRGVGRGAPVRRPEFWALKDVCLEVKRGEVLGIIGRNGAGKSTLLKILSQITEPTEGRVRIRGRVASLLEIGTGFHPELTGRENVLLNGAILGMSRAEILAKFDDIISFAEVERFIDTPVKHYSSGMYVRLAFAVAAHLEPDILIVDEVLAVGDASFQKKCLNKLGDAGHRGRTVIFVSHDMSAVTRLCERAILLNEGHVIDGGPAHQIVGTYLQSGLGTPAAREWRDAAWAPGNHVARLRAVSVRTEDGRVADALDIRRPILIEMQFDVVAPGHVLVPNFHVYNEEGICLFVVGDQSANWRRRPRPEGRYVSTAIIPGNFMAEGNFVVQAALSTMDPVTIHFWERNAVAFHVVDSLDGDSARGDYAGPYIGVVRPLVDWTTEFTPAPRGVAIAETAS